MKPSRPLERDPFPDDYGVLLSDKIKYYANMYGMIDPFCEDCLEPAGYQMRIGKTYYSGQERMELCEGKFLEIKPYDVVIIETTESISVPRFMIARWNIKVKLAYRGLLWVGAAQVDPGYVGNLACPIYNLSRETVRLKRNEKLALIDFVKTTPYSKERCKPFASFPSRGIDDVVRKEGIESALSQYEGRVGTVEKQMQEAETRSTYFTTLIITLLGVLFAVLVGSDSIKSIPDWGSWLRTGSVVLSLALSATALALSLSRKRGSSFTRRSLAAVKMLVVAVISFLLGLCISSIVVG